MKPEDSAAWMLIVGAAGTLAGFALGYTIRSTGDLQPGPGHLYLIGTLHFVDDGFIRKMRYHHPKAIHQGADGMISIMSPVGTGVSLRRWEAPIRLRDQSGELYLVRYLVTPSPTTMEAMEAIWIRDGLLRHMGRWKTWPTNPRAPPDGEPGAQAGQQVLFSPWR